MSPVSFGGAEMWAVVLFWAHHPLHSHGKTKQHSSKRTMAGPYKEHYQNPKLIN